MKTSMELEGQKVVINITEDVRTMDKHMHVNAPKSKFVPAYVYYLLEAHSCKTVSFNTSLATYKIEDLKGKENWKDVK